MPGVWCPYRQLWPGSEAALPCGDVIGDRAFPMPCVTSALLPPGIDLGKTDVGIAGFLPFFLAFTSSSVLFSSSNTFWGISRPREQR